ncbi:IS5/IS1182 family transposase, partial [Streptomyces sp. NPDC058418]
MITYQAMLDVPRELAQYLSRLRHIERRRRSTRKNSRALTCFRQAVLGLRWFRQNVEVTALARDHGISRATGYRYLDEVIEVLANQAPDLHEALQKAKADGLAYVVLDGKIFCTDRCDEKTTSVKRKQVDLWCSGKAHEHGGDIQA